jgi:MFS family permease
MQIASLFGGIGRAFNNRVFVQYWASNGVSTVGRWIYRTAVMWFTWELTESTSWLGIVAFADVFPMIVLSIFAGAIADRIGYMRLIKACQLSMVLLTTVFSLLIVTGLINIELVVILSIIHGSTEAMSTPPRVAIVNALVERKDLSSAIALNSATFNAARVLGPAIAGGLLLVLDVGAVLGIAMLTFIQFYILTLFLRVAGAGGEGKISMELVADMWHGVVYTWRAPGIRFLMMVLTLVGLLLRPFMELAPGFAAQVFDLGPDGLATILSSIGVGAMVASLWLALRGRTQGLTKLVTVSLALQTVMLILFTATGNIVLAVVFLLGFGFFMLVTGVGSQTLIQNTVEPQVRARVMSLFILLSWGLPALGALLMGWIASFAGLQLTVGAGAALVLLLYLWVHRAGWALAPDLEAEEAERSAA